MGMAIGLVFAWLMTKALGNYDLVFSVPVGQMLIFLLLAALVGVAAAAVPARRGSRIEVLDAIHTE
jgi:putative ABC transport system permease protein